MRLLSFDSADRQISSMALAPASSFVSAAFGGSHFSQPSRLPCAPFLVSVPRAGVVSLLFCDCKDQSEKVGLLASASHFYPFILWGTSSEEMELQVKISRFVLAAEPQISRFLSYCLTFCLCLCYRNRAKGLCVQVFCSL